MGAAHHRVREKIDWPRLCFWTAAIIGCSWFWTLLWRFVARMGG